LARHAREAGLKNSKKPDLRVILMDHYRYRPQRQQGQGDVQLPRVAQALQSKLKDLQDDFAHDTLCLDDDGVQELAGCLVDFADDLHNSIGIWRAYERHNSEFFGSPLPVTATTTTGSGLNLERLRHFLWILYPALIEGLTLSTTHPDLHRVAEASNAFLSNAFQVIPKDSGVESFLQSANEFGWDVKRKLVWLGSRSYMFRMFYSNYMDEHAEGTTDIGHTDDFICQECTRWSGLGVTDILAGVLDIGDDDRRDLRSWYERHAAFFKLLAVNNETLEAINIISDQPYRIRINMEKHPFEAGQLIFGSLVPWRGEWYWSGEQQLFGNASDVDVDELRQNMKRNNSQIVCRYWKDYEVQVCQKAADLHEAMMAYHGKDLVVYPDGLSMAADWQKELRRQWDSKPPHEVKAVMKEHALAKGRPNMSLPKEFVDHRNGLGVFINPDEGKEIMQDFALLISGLQREGEALTEDEEEVIRGFVYSTAISPRFVKRVVGEFGGESVKRAFRLQSGLPSYWLDYLLRSYKGCFFRKRYPTVAVI
jgi:hypothetical protein